MHRLNEVTLALAITPGILYSFKNLYGAFARGMKWEDIDPSHIYKEGESKIKPPSQWFVNLAYHIRHHLETGDAYYSGVLPIGDKVLGTALSFKRKKVAITGANSVLGKALIKMFLSLGVKKVVALVREEKSLLQFCDDNKVEVREWAVGKENELYDILSNIHILVTAHGIKPNNNDSDTIAYAQEVNVNSVLRLSEVFFKTVKTHLDVAQKELWCATSLAEVITVKGYPAYESSKKQLGDILSAYLRHEAPCIVRKLILDGFNSPMSPNDHVHIEQYIRWIIFFAKRDRRNILVCRNLWRFWLVNLLVIWRETLLYWLYR